MLRSTVAPLLGLEASMSNQFDRDYVRCIVDVNIKPTYS